MTSPIDFHEEFNDPMADVVIISSDNIGFRIQRKILRDVPTPTNEGPNSEPKAIELTDKVLEASKVLRLFFSALEGRDLPTPSSESFELVRSALQLTNKYECPQARRAFLYDLTRYVPIGLEDATAWTIAQPLLIFKLAAKHNDVRLAATALSHGGRWVWQPSRDGTEAVDDSLRARRSIAGASAFDLSAWTVEEVAELNSRYGWALLRATRDLPLSTLSVGDQLGKYDWVKAAQRFQDILLAVAK